MELTSSMLTLMEAETLTYKNELVDDLNSVLETLLDVTSPSEIKRLVSERI